MKLNNALMCRLDVEGWKPVPCQRDDCQSTAEVADAVKLCLDHRVAVAQLNNNENGPLLVLCASCADEVRRLEPPGNHAGNQQQPVEPLVDLLLPMLQVATLCDNTVHNQLHPSPLLG